MFDKSQIMRGTLEGCILKLIETNETYGYELMEMLKEYGFTDIKEGTIYPLLVRLEKKELISSEFKASPLGPSRKYYFITKEGIEMLASFQDCWNSISESVNRILELEVK